jgi:MFS family permease
VYNVGSFGLRKLNNSCREHLAETVKGPVIEMLAKDWRHWLASKVFIGIGNGLAQTSLVIYNSEIAPPRIRGFLLATWAWTFSVGGFIATVGLQILAEVSNYDDTEASVLMIPVLPPGGLSEDHLHRVGVYWNLCYIPSVLARDRV